jgi:hypothetical protein
LDNYQKTKRLIFFGGNEVFCLFYVFYEKIGEFQALIFKLQTDLHPRLKKGNKAQDFIGAPIRNV